MKFRLEYEYHKNILIFLYCYIADYHFPRLLIDYLLTY